MSYNDNFNAFEEDPAAEFLEREKRELGDLTADNDINETYSPFMDNVTEVGGSNTTEETNAGFGRNSLLTNGSHSPMGGSVSPLSHTSARSETPSTSMMSGHGNYSVLSQLDEQQNEPEKIKKWREEFQQRIVKKDADEETKKKEMKEQAKKELDDWYKNRLEQMERVKNQNRMNNRTMEDELFHSGNESSSTMANGNNDKRINDWDKITSLCEFNPKNIRSQKDLTRYRSLLLQLKQTPINK
ncbi:unnamed protein product [Didymodactylos carnosus]|nr:unnamed protein product [Didymodactylos carnosus]CAF3915955.1 unnamed protein product [Didymodactylos carnosus]